MSCASAWEPRLVMVRSLLYCNARSGSIALGYASPNSPLPSIYHRRHFRPYQCRQAFGLRLLQTFHRVQLYLAAAERPGVQLPRARCTAYLQNANDLAREAVSCNPQCRPVASWYGRNSPAYRHLGYNALAPEAETRTRTGALEPVLQPGTSVAAILLLVALVAFHLRPR